MKRVYDINLADNVVSDMRLKRNNNKYHTRNFYNIFYIYLALGKSYTSLRGAFFETLSLYGLFYNIGMIFARELSVTMFVFFSANVPTYELCY